MRKPKRLPKWIYALISASVTGSSSLTTAYLTTDPMTKKAYMVVLLITVSWFFVEIKRLYKISSPRSFKLQPKTGCYTLIMPKVI